MAMSGENVVRNDAFGKRSSVVKSALRVGIAIVVLALAANIQIPAVPVPFTLQILALGVIVATYKPAEAAGATLGYLGLGAIGFPVFAGFMGGMGKLLGTTGGFIIGFVIGAIVATVIRELLTRHSVNSIVAAAIAVVLAIAVSYFFGWAQLVVVAQLTPAAAFAAGCAPFIVADCVKAAIAVAISRPVAKAIYR